MATTIVLTQGHISIRHGRVTRQYHHPTRTSMHRLVHLTQYGACEETTYTNRSSITVWHGLSTLSETQLAIYRLYLTAKRDRINSDNRLSLCPSGCFDLQAKYRDYAVYDGYFYLGVQAACQAAGIHPAILDSDYYHRRSNT